MTDSQDDGDVILMLVAALEAILAYEGDDLPGPGTYGEEVYTTARAAITKALGRLSRAQKQRELLALLTASVLISRSDGRLTRTGDNI